MPNEQRKIMQPVAPATASGVAPPPSPPAPRRRIGRWLLAIVALVGLMLLAAWLALPRIIQSQARAFVSEKTGHTLSMDLPAFNPFSLRLHLPAIALARADGEPLLACDALTIDLSWSGLARRALVFDAIDFDGLRLTLALDADGRLNWSPFVDALAGPPSPPSGQATELPRLHVAHLSFERGAIDVADRTRKPAFSTRVAPLEITLDDVSTRADREGRYTVSATTALGARLDLEGALTVEPLGVAGHLRLSDLKLQSLSHYIGGLLPAPPQGTLQLATDYRIAEEGDHLGTRIGPIGIDIADLQLALPSTATDAAGPRLQMTGVKLEGGTFAWPAQQVGFEQLTLGDGTITLPGIEVPWRFASLGLAGAKADLQKRDASLDRLSLDGLTMQISRAADGTLDVQRAFAPAAAPDAAPVADASMATAPATTSAAAPVAANATPTPAWTWAVGSVEIAGASLAMRDAGVSPAAEFTFKPISLRALKLGHDLAAAVPLNASATLASGGKLSVEGTVQPGAAAGDLRIALEGLALPPAQPYVAAFTPMQLGSGQLAARGRLRFGGKLAGPLYQGSFDLRDLRLDDPALGNAAFLSLQRLGSPKFSASTERLDMPELHIVGLDTTVVIAKDKSVNLSRLVRTAEPAAPPATLATTAPTAPAGPGYRVDVGRVRVEDSELEFADHSLVLPFGTRIHALAGSIAGISTQPGTAGELELEGQVDEFGQARAAGRLELFDPTAFMDLKVQFANVAMPRLSPYAATFAGRKIDTGKLSLDLQYKIAQRQLQGENQIVIERLTLGDPVESASAISMPLNLAIALLEDADGRIDLGLPVSGSLDDPQFSYGQIVWKAIVNVLTKIVTSPFRALGALLGGGGEALDTVGFEPGAVSLAPPEREKLVRISNALSKRPALKLGVTALHTAADRAALQDRAARRAVLAQAGESVPAEGDPGPLTTQQPRMQAALEALYAKRIGEADLAALKEGFRAANPGQLPQSTGGKMLSRLTGLWKEKKPLSAGEIEQLKGADFHALLFERLRDAEVVGDDALVALATARATGAVEQLKALGVKAERIDVKPPEKGEADGKSGAIPLKLELGAGK